MKHGKQRQHSACPLLGRNWDLSLKGFFLVACFSHLHLDFWFRNLWLTRILHHPVLPEPGVSAPLGWPRATLQSYRKTKPTFTTGKFILPGSEWLTGHNSRLFFSHMGLICAAYTNTVVSKRFPDPAGTHLLLYQLMQSKAAPGRRSQSCSRVVLMWVIDTGTGLRCLGWR